MNKEQIKKLAKEFCEAEHIYTKKWIARANLHHIRVDKMLSDFLQYAIE